MPTLARLLLPALLFIVLLLCFLYGVATIGATSQAEQAKSLDAAVHRAMVHCYATEGHYPATVADMESHYGITYDHSAYRVDYTSYGSNIMPDVTIVQLGATR